MRMVSTMVLRACVAGVLCLGGWGCQSFNVPASASFASVKIGGRTLEDIRGETTRVFKAAGYESTPTSDGFMFEREGSRRDQMAYGSAIDKGNVRIRVRTQIVAVGGQLYRLQCTAYAVRSGRAGMGDEIRLPGWRSGPFQDLLEQVSRNLKGVIVIRTD